MSQGLVVVCGGGGFIGGHLVKDLLAQGWRVRSIDIKPLEQWEQLHSDAENLSLDLSQHANCLEGISGATKVFQLAADMGGIGFIEAHKAECMLSVLINTHALMAAKHHGVEQFFYSSSACVYAADKQSDAHVTALKEEDAYPAMPEDGYGWEKLFSERMCRHFREDYGMKTRVARYHNVYGPLGTWQGGREKAPAAISRKVAIAKLTGKHDIEIWGDGEQTRSFMYIDDCVVGSQKILASDVEEPLNLGSEELVSVNELVDIVEEIAGIKLQRRYKTDAPMGVRGRNSDNTRIRQQLGWAPSVSLRDGMAETYAWVFDQVKADLNTK